MLASQMGSKKTGLILALLGTLWLGAWPFLGFGAGPGSLLAVVIGIGLLWEGFGRLALAKGLPRLHGAFALTVLAVHILLRVIWAAPTHGFQAQEVEAHYFAIALSYVIVPVGLSWLLFYLSTQRAEKRLRNR